MKPTRTTDKQASETDWQRVDTMPEDAIDTSDIAEITPEMFASAAVKQGGVPVKTPKQAISLRVDPEVLAWFKAHGEGYQTHMHAVLAAYVKAQKDAKDA